MSRVRERGARIPPLTQSCINDRNIRFIRLFIVAYLGDRDRELAKFLFFFFSFCAHRKGISIRLPDEIEPKIGIP